MFLKFVMFEIRGVNKYIIRDNINMCILYFLGNFIRSYRYENFKNIISLEGYIILNFLV